ncbi:MAG: hypothetical protein AAF629_04835 [Chloroflexota bacterium]
MKVLKRRLVMAVAAVALAIAVTGSGSVIADAVGFGLTPHVEACVGASGGGGC